MSFVRVSVVNPARGHASDASRLMALILAQCSQRPGYLGGALLSPSLGAGESLRIVGRITLWTSRLAADRTAQELRMLALRSELSRYIVEDGHHEHAFDAVTFGSGLAGLPGEPALAVPGRP